MGNKCCKAVMVFIMLCVFHVSFANTTTTPTPSKHPAVHHHPAPKKTTVHHKLHTPVHKAASTHHKVNHHHVIHHSVMPATTHANLSNLPQVDEADTDTNENASPLNGHRLVSFVDHFISSLRYTRYKSGGNFFDSTRGIYEADCSHYVDRILQEVCPRAYWKLTASTGSEDPDTANYYNFFSRLSETINPDWNKIDNANQLQPGDVVVFRYKNSAGEMDGGHVMVVMGTPTRGADGLLVRVSDSAFSGHSDDTRPAHDSGVGVGTILLKVDPATGEPYAYAWDIDSPWKSNVNIAMARPTDFS